MKNKYPPVRIDIKRQTSIPSMSFVQGDTVNYIDFSIFDDAIPFDLTGKTMTVTVKKSDGEVVIADTLITGINSLECRIGTNALSCPGLVQGTIEIYDGPDRLTTNVFNYYVREEYGGGLTQESTTDYPILGELLNDTYRKSETYSRTEIDAMGIGLGGTGNMDKATYDTDDDGIVDVAETLYGLNSTAIQIDQAVNGSHTHGNQSDLDRLAIDPTTGKLTIDGTPIVASGGTSNGDMLKSDYDTNGNGIVDKAESVEWSGVNNAPTNLSQFNNDQGFITINSVPPAPTNLSQLNNDIGFITANNIPPIPTLTSELTNDSNFVTQAQVTSMLASSSAGSGTGDMLQSIYDADNDGVVDKAETLDGLNSTVIQIDQSVSNSHVHANRFALDRLSIDANNKLTIDGTPLVTGAGDMQASVYDTDNDGIVDKAETLAGMTSTVAQLEQSIANSHTHTRTDTQIINAVDNAHVHVNKIVIDGLTDNGGQLEYNGVSVGANLTPTDIKTMYESNPNTYAFDSTYKSKVDSLAASSGDMSKSVYDTDGDGVVDSALFAQSANALTGQLSSIVEINYLVGTSSNIQSQINALKQGMKWKGEVTNYAALPLGVQGDTYIVTTDENHDSNRTFYTHDGTSWVYLGEFSIAVRDFLLQPVDLATETTGILQESKIDPLIARKAELHNHTNKTDVLDKLGKDATTGGLTFDGILIGGAGGSTIIQRTLLGLTASPANPYVSTIEIPSKPSYAHAPVNVLKSIQGKRNETVTLLEFNESEKADTSVANDTQIVFNGVMKLETQEIKPMAEILYGTGKMLIQAIDQSDKKNLEKIEIF